MSQNRKRNKKFDPIINDARRDLLPLSRTAASTPRRTTLIRARPRAAAVHHFKRLVKRPTRWGATGVTTFAELAEAQAQRRHAARMGLVGLQHMLHGVGGAGIGGSCLSMLEVRQGTPMLGDMNWLHHV